VSLLESYADSDDESSAEANWRKTVALNGFVHLAGHMDSESIPSFPGSVAPDVEQANEVIVQLMQASLAASAKRLIPHLPSLDVMSAMIAQNTIQDLDISNAAIDRERTRAPVSPDEV
jgi:hypothetical protein